MRDLTEEDIDGLCENYPTADIKIWLDPTEIDDWSEDNIRKLVFGRSFSGELVTEKDSIFVLCKVDYKDYDRFLKWLDNNPSVEAFLEPAREVLASVNQIRESVRSLEAK
jgi:hypothetical protein